MLHGVSKYQACDSRGSALRVCVLRRGLSLSKMQRNPWLGFGFDSPKTLNPKP